MSEGLMSSEERIWKTIDLEEPDRVPCFIDTPENELASLAAF